MPRTPHSSLNDRSVSPSRVPPDQSSTASPAAAQGRVGVAARQLPRDAGQPGPEGEHLHLGAPPTTAAWAKRISARAYGSIDPLTSSSSTSRRGRSLGGGIRGRIGSPPVAAPCGPCGADRGWPAGRRDRPSRSDGRCAPPPAGPPSAGAARRARRRCRWRSPCGAASRSALQRTCTTWPSRVGLVLGPSSSPASSGSSVTIGRAPPAAAGGPGPGGALPEHPRTRGRRRGRPRAGGRASSAPPSTRHGAVDAHRGQRLGEGCTEPRPGRRARRRGAGGRRRPRAPASW